MGEEAGAGAESGEAAVRRHGGRARGPGREGGVRGGAERQHGGRSAAHL